MQIDVLVVGAGPTGLMLGTELGLAGVTPVVIDALPTPSGQAKGGGVQPRTAEIFDLRGMTDQLLDRALQGEPVGGHFGGLPVELDCRPWNTRHPYPVAIPQWRIEQWLTERLAGYGISVRRGHELIALHPDDDGVTATVHDQAIGTDLHIRARYLVACDGGHSTVRTLLGVPFPGQAGSRPAVLADVRLTSISDLVPTRISHFAAMVRDGGGYWSMLNPLEGNLYRLVFGSFEATIEEQRRDRPVEADEVRHALQAVWGPDTELGEVTWGSRFSDATRQVEHYRAGRVLFAGDAAHIHSPLGGQGLNLGIQDAFNLGWKLAAQVQGRAPAGLLDSYHTERHPAAARVLHHTRAQRVLADRRPTDDVAALRDIVTDLVRLPDTNRYLAGMMSGLDVRYPIPSGDHPLLGARMPDIDLVVDGVATRFSALMHTGRGVLVDFTENGHVTDALDDRIDLRRATTTDIDVTAVLLRPDGHICWLSSAAQRRDPSLHAAIEQWFGGRSQPAKPGCQR
ncbi:MAG TPA: FAD-dependent monooxygenase [Pseudonocardiaceae bacterium]|nr:FAD-dependent monooxygenase [Pseudonocardiaceae bacterium]